jgi:hypothetical protein
VVPAVHAPVVTVVTSQTAFGLVDVLLVSSESQLDAAATQTGLV